MVLAGSDTSAGDTCGMGKTDVSLQMGFTFGAIVSASQATPFAPERDMTEADSPRMAASPAFAEAARR